jgi:hypothetical protein
VIHSTGVFWCPRCIRWRTARVLRKGNAARSHTHTQTHIERPISIHTRRRVDGLSTASRSTKVSAPKKEPSKAIKGGLDPRPRVGVNEGVTHFGFGRLLVGFGSSNSAASDTPSTSGGGASPASAATVGYLGRFASQHCKSSAETEQSGASSGTFFSAGERSFCPDIITSRESAV